MAGGEATRARLGMPEATGTGAGDRWCRVSRAGETTKAEVRIPPATRKRADRSTEVILMGLKTLLHSSCIRPPLTIQ